MNLVKALREKRGWSQEQLAKVSGVAKRTIQRAETGAVETSAETAMALSQHLGVEPDEILNWSGVRYHLRACVDRWHQRPPTEEEIATLPPKFRPLFVAYHEEIAEMKRSQEAVARIGGELQRVHEKAEVLRAERQADMRSLFDSTGDTAKALDILNIIESRRAAMDQVDAERDAVNDELLRVGERMMELRNTTGDVARRLDRELEAYDVFGVYSRPRALD